MASKKPQNENIKLMFLYYNFYDNLWFNELISTIKIHYELFQ